MGFGGGREEWRNQGTEREREKMKRNSAEEMEGEILLIMNVRIER